jgi:hypothetical protein
MRWGATRTVTGAGAGDRSADGEHTAYRSNGNMGAVTDPTFAPRRVSRRIGAIAESATLAVDAKAKALKAQGRPVIGFRCR